MQILTAEQRAALMAQQSAALSHAGLGAQHSLGTPRGGLPSSGANLSLSMGMSLGLSGGMSGGMPPPSDLLQTDDQKRQELERVYIVKQQRWLLFLRHASKCTAVEGQCPFTPHCHVARKLWEHVLSCQNGACNYPRCVASRELLKHHQRCQDPQCPVCAPVRQAMQKQRSGQGPGGAQQQVSMGMSAAQQQQAVMRQGGYAVAQAVASHAAGGGRSGHGPSKRARMEAAPPQQQQPSTQLIERGVTRARSGAAGPEGTSLCECFSEEEIRVHLASLRIPETKLASGVPMSARRREQESAAVMAAASPTACKACGVEKLSFEPPPMYCTNCNVRIKPKQTYYLAGAPTQSDKQTFCTGCFSGFGPSIEIDGNRFAKNQLTKRKNEEDLEESWVACDSCEAWVHQICTLFNGRRNENGDSAFTCPSCILEQMSRGERQPTVARPSSQQPASALPKNVLSDFLEEHLSSRLTAERAERARVLGKQPEEVPGAEGLCIRVVSCITKQMAVKPEFRRAFGPSGYPSSFLYRSKVVMLFQKIEGVDVCLFCMYVQEYGADQPHPNNRRVYLSYLDSIKYFRPEVMSVRNNEALRTYVYHTLLVGYLEYVKRRGFTSVYIWGCPPLPGEDYILYCHPTRQKTPKSDKLREWYIKMLGFAQSEGLVVSLGNLFDELKLDREEPRSAMDVLYFDGDYWPGAAEEFIVTAQEEEAKRRAAAKAGAGGAAKRDRSKSKRLDRPDGSLEALDASLMCKLGENIRTMKHDFIMVHLWHECNRCRRTIENARRWCSAPEEAHYELCEECYEAEAALAVEERGWKGALQPQPVPALPDTRDPDGELECEFFDTRQAFLSMCQGNKFQFDTLRRAKHSSMMVLFHLHNPTEPAFVATCNLCTRELDPGTGWRCETCPDFDVCDDCRRYRGHAHPLKPQGNRRDTTRAMSKEERQARLAQLQRTMELLVHASACGAQSCTSSNCAKVKSLFQHAFSCQLKATGGCGLCRRLWTLLQVHAKGCFQANCPVPRCQDLKEYRRRAAEQVEERRRQAFVHYRQLNAQGA